MKAEALRTAEERCKAIEKAKGEIIADEFADELQKAERLQPIGKVKISEASKITSDLFEEKKPKTVEGERTVKKVKKKAVDYRVESVSEIISDIGKNDEQNDRCTPKGKEKTNRCEATMTPKGKEEINRCEAETIDIPKVKKQRRHH